MGLMRNLKKFLQISQPAEACESLASGHEKVVCHESCLRGIYGCCCRKHAHAQRTALLPVDSRSRPQFMAPAHAHTPACMLLEGPACVHARSVRRTQAPPSNQQQLLLTRQSKPVSAHQAVPLTWRC